MSAQESKKKKRPKDLNKLAFSILEDATPDSTPKKRKEEEKNPHAVALGKLGDLKGGKAYAEKLSPEERIERARKAARARWKKED